MALTVESIETAIEAILNGSQAYKLMDREFRYADLKELWDMRRDLKAEGEASSGIQFTAARFNQPTA